MPLTWKIIYIEAIVMMVSFLGYVSIADDPLEGTLFKISALAFFAFVVTLVVAVYLQ